MGRTKQLLFPHSVSDSGADSWNNHTFWGRNMTISTLVEDPMLINFGYRATWNCSTMAAKSKMAATYHNNVHLTWYVVVLMIFVFLHG
jgi:hypothetical protein